MSFFKCKHPFHNLLVEKQEEQVDSDLYPNEFWHVTYFFRCSNCGEKINKTYAKGKRSFKDQLDVDVAKLKRDTSEFL